MAKKSLDEILAELYIDITKLEDLKLDNSLRPTIEGYIEKLENVIKNMK